MNKASIDISGPLVSTDWLKAHLEADNVRIIDGTYFLPTDQRDAAIEYEAEHIPGACFFDIDEINLSYGFLITAKILCVFFISSLISISLE